MIMKNSSYLPKSERAQKLNVIYHLYAKRLGKWAMTRFSISQDDLEDALQETFRNVAEHLDDLKEPTDRETYSYLRVVLKNNIIDFFRKQNRSRIYVTDVEPDTIIDEEDSPEEVVIRQYNAQVTCDQIRRLPDVYKDVLVLRYFCDLSYKQIADALKVNENLVAVRLHRGKEYLRRSLRQYEGDI